MSEKKPGQYFELQLVPNIGDAPFPDLENDFAPAHLIPPNQTFQLRIARQREDSPPVLVIRGALPPGLIPNAEDEANEFVLVMMAPQIQMLGAALYGWFGDLTGASELYGAMQRAAEAGAMGGEPEAGAMGGEAPAAESAETADAADPPLGTLG